MLQEQNPPPTILDVRPSNLFSICHLPNAISLPLSSLTVENLSSMITQHIPSTSEGTVGVICKVSASALKALKPQDTSLISSHSTLPPPPLSLYQRGNASRSAMELITKHYTGPLQFINVKGGMNEWHHSVDPKFPLT